MTLEGNEYVVHKSVNVEWQLVSTDGLVVPVIKDVDNRDTASGI